jgi:hypothetical protein
MSSGISISTRGRAERRIICSSRLEAMHEGRCGCFVSLSFGWAISAYETCYTALEAEYDEMIDKKNECIEEVDLKSVLHIIAVFIVHGSWEHGVRWLLVRFEQCKTCLRDDKAPLILKCKREKKRPNFH